MNIQKHEIKLGSEEHFEGRIPPRHLGFLFEELPVAVEQAVSMSLRNRSKTPGRQPDWLKRASDLRFTGLSGNGTTELQFEIPTLDSSATEIYSQKMLFDDVRPAGELTGLDLLINVIEEVESGKEDSNAYDPQLLKRLNKFRRFFESSPFSDFQISEAKPQAANK